jgi:hypothetical protein
MKSSDDFRPLYRTMVGLGLVAVVILAVGVVTLARLGPFGQHSGYHARVDGFYRYDSRTGLVVGPSSTHFQRDQQFAARVEWNRLPPSMVVAARWADSLGTQVGGVGPEPAGQLASERALVPETIPPPLHANLPGNYTLYILRYKDGQPVELIDTAYVQVLLDP